MYELFISGIVSKSSLRVLRTGLNRHYETKLCLEFFCLYSGYDISIGSTFAHFHNHKTNSILNIDAILIDVTQQWGLPFSGVPKGSRTLVRIEFEKEKTIIELKTQIPVIEKWEDSPYDFTLVGGSVG